MKFIGYSVEKILAENKKLIKENLEVSTDISIKNVFEDEIELFKEETPLKISFEFKVEYKPGFADIMIKGAILILFEKKLAKEILKEWAKNKKVPEDIRIDLFNFIISKTTLRAIQIEEELGVPYHLPLPRLEKK